MANPIFDLVGKLQRKLWKRPESMRVDFRADGLGVRRKNLDFLNEFKFKAAWENSVALNRDGWAKVKGGVPDIRWRAHVCCWAAQHGLSLEGDFVECGVHTGILSLVVAERYDFASVPKTFWLFDTYEGIPLEGLDADAKAHAQGLNETIYFDVFKIATRNFSKFPNARLVKGILPQSLESATIEKIAYLSVDLNHAAAEKATIEALWDKLVPGAVVVIDDYAFENHEDQYAMWNDFASSKGKMVLTLPTGQGILIK